MEKLAELIGSLKDYFNDFVGAIIPGTVLAAGIILIAGQRIAADALTSHWGEWSWLPGLALIFLLGHALLSLSDLARDVRHRGVMRVVKELVTSETPLEQAKKGSAYRTFHELMVQKSKHAGVVTEFDFSTTRNIAMSLTNSGADLGRRFMFISLFCRGTSAAAWIAAATVAVTAFFGDHTKIQMLAGIFSVSAAVAVLLGLRGRAFELRAHTTPFSVALAELLFHPSNCADDEKNGRTPQ
jgi:hypothetical protein